MWCYYLKERGNSKTEGGLPILAVLGDAEVSAWKGKKKEMGREVVEALILGFNK